MQFPQSPNADGDQAAGDPSQDAHAVQYARTPADPHALAAEALCLVTGLFPDSLTPGDGADARGLPRAWYESVCATCRARRPERFRMFRQPDAEKTWHRLQAPLDQNLTQALDDPGLITAYLTQLEACRRYVLQLWPALTIETWSGPEYVQPSLSGLGEAYSVLALFGARDRLIHELAAGTLTSAQAEAFKALCPGLYDMVRQFLDYERGRMRRRQDRISSWAEGVLRVLLGMGPDAREMTSPADEPSPAQPEPQLPSLAIDFASYATRAQSRG